MLSHSTRGWNKELRTEYFRWFDKAIQKKGGESYKPFLDNIRLNALDNVSESEQEEYRQMSGFYSPIKAMAELPKPIGPGKNYDLYDLGRILLWGTQEKMNDYSGTHADGLRAYQAAMCSSCHRMNGEGGSSGPDLSQINTRFNTGDISNAILSPSEEISDQYVFSSFTLKNGDQINGRILEEDESEYMIFQSPYDPSIKTSIAKDQVKEVSLSAISPMPAELLNALNEDEVKDLLVFLMSAGDPDHEVYTKKKM